MCVKEAQGQRIAEGDLSPETFARLAPALPTLRTLILNGIGEPLLHPRLEDFIRVAKRAMPASGEVGFQTNGQLLRRERAYSLADAGVDRICLSADAVSAEMFGKLRCGGRLERIEAAAAALHQAGRDRGRPISLGLEFVAMRDNLPQLPEVVRWAAKNHFSFVIVTHMLAYERELSGAAAFDPITDHARQVHRDCRERAAADGVDLRGYIGLFTTYKDMSAADWRRKDYVANLIAQASAQDVRLSYQRLVNCDEVTRDDTHRTAAWFAEAERCAEQEGIDLRLPATAPTRQRRCNFVEDGSCFVSWKGDLHPCYFLWHRYSCHVGGLHKHVEPVSFGNLVDRDVLTIWNDARARRFRGDVLRYDYPFCYDCNVALCNFSQDEEFAGDCHGSAVPCGACLWSTGVFQCLS
jgi:putative metalloenzyme radical SAM/SPASM domain maturase